MRHRGNGVVMQRYAVDINFVIWGLSGAERLFVYSDEGVCGAVMAAAMALGVMFARESASAGVDLSGYVFVDSWDAYEVVGDCAFNRDLRSLCK